MRNNLLSKRYLQRGETENDMYKRVANAVCKNRYDKDFTLKAFNAMQNFYFLPNSPTLANAGTDKVGGLSACYVLPINDSLESIYKTLHDTALVHKFFGGTGFDFSNIRPKGSPIVSTGGESCGVLKVIELFNQGADTIQQGGKREGANMGVLRCDHPDIEEFIRAKEHDGVLTHFNLSVAATDDFMKKGDADLVDQIVHHAWLHGDPGIIFIDAINRNNVNKHLYDIAATNPCIEGSQRVLTSRGWIPIRDILIGDDVMSLGGRTKIVNHTLTGTKEVITLVLKNGMELTCTPDHKLYTSEGWVEAKDCVNKEVRVNTSALEFYEDDPNLDLAELTGFWYGDGCLSCGRVSLSCGIDKEVAARYSTMMNNLFRCRTTITQSSIQRSGNRYYRVTSGKQNVVEYFTQFNKSIPPMNLDTSHTIAFLRGLYTADGHIETNNGAVTICLTSTRREFIRNIQLLLSGLGVKSVFYEVRRTWHASDEKYNITSNNYYRLNITGKSRIKFLEEIGFNRETSDYPDTSAYNTKDYVKCISILPHHSLAEVYDITVEDESHSFICEGMMVRNCGEQPLGPYESCNLGSLNLSKFVVEGDFDLDLFKEHIRMGVRFLDSVIDINNFPIPEIHEATLATRKIGLGIMGWHDLLIQLEIPYASREAMEPIHVIGNVLRKTSIDESCILAEEYGVYPAWEGSEWQKRGIEIRNSTLLTIAPTGTISYLAGCSSGIEPHFAKDFTRTSEAGSTSYHLDINDAEISHNINWQWHLNHQANWQKYIDNAVSKTINLPSSATESYIREIYKTAHSLKCKGVTVYRDGSKASQVLTTNTPPVTSKSYNLPLGVTRRPGHVYGVQSGCGKMYVIVDAEDESFSQLREVFVLTAGGCAANNESTGRLISDSLEAGMDPNIISETLHKVKCINAMRNSAAIGKSCSDIIGKCIDWELRDYINGVEKKEVPTCPDCGKPLNFGSGCAQGECPNCGWSGCS